jgi:hypothetical protein
MASEGLALDKAELRKVFAAFKGMDETAQDEAKRQTSALAEYAKGEIETSAQNLNSRKVASRIASGAKVKKSSKIGELTYGFASQKFSGGATTKDIWGGSEFGSNQYKQFPVWSGREGRGSKGWFIYPTLRRIQPKIVSEWTEAFDRILKRFA